MFLKCFKFNDALNDLFSYTQSWNLRFTVSLVALEGKERGTLHGVNLTLPPKMHLDKWLITWLVLIPLRSKTDFWWSSNNEISRRSSPETVKEVLLEHVGASRPIQYFRNRGVITLTDCFQSIRSKPLLKWIIFTEVDFVALFRCTE